MNPAPSRLEPAEKEVREYSASGRRTTCFACGRKLEHPRHGGRPRVVCKRRECINARHTAIERSYRHRWTRDDSSESLRLWRGACACCEGNDRIRMKWDSTGAAMFPACWNCNARESEPARLKAWVARVKPGCPLPDPWKAGP